MFDGNTCFLFLPNSAALITYPSLVLDQQGQIIEPYIERDQAAFMRLQAEKTLIVLPTELATLHQLNLPHLSEKKAALAIQFSLEPKLPQPVDTLHLAWFYDPATQNYQVACIDKIYFQGLIQQLQQAGIHYDRIHLDFSALQSAEAVELPHMLLLNSDEFQGAVPSSLRSLYEPLLKKVKLESPEHAPLWIAQRLLNLDRLNLCQGEFTSTAHTPSQKKLYYLAASLCLLWLFSLFLNQGIRLYSLNQRLISTQTQIAEQYRFFFPHAKQIISPRFRVEQLLKHQHPSSSLWILFDKLSQASQGITYSLQSCDFHHQKLSLSLSLQQFESLEKLEKNLKTLNVQVKQTQSSQQANHVNASLELSL